MTVSCHSCIATFADYKELALHISSSRKGHRSGKRWAAKYIAINMLSAEKRNGKKTTRTPLTETEKENKLDSKRELSGKHETVVTICPQCKKGQRQLLPEEFTSSPLAWRIKDCLAVLCPLHGSNRHLGTQ